MSDRGKVKAGDWVEGFCTEVGGDCSKTKCCKDGGNQCYKKNEYWASCNASCTAGQLDEGDTGGWECEAIGSRTPRPWGTPSLFCTALIRPTGYEPGLMRTCLLNSAGIFGCDEYAVYSSTEVDIGPGPLGFVKAIPFEQAEVGTSIHGTAANTQQFINYWNAVNTDGRWRDHDWVIKADPDAVVVPIRIRTHLKGWTGQATYVRTCNKYPESADFPMMFGALEALSVPAMEIYYPGLPNCLNSLPDWQDWGEDYFMGKCMDMLGITPQDDFELVGDNVCTGADCSRQDQAAFHPFKDEASWLSCWVQAGR